MPKMPKVSRNVTYRKDIRKKFGFLRFLVIVLSFISLISRIIYCTFATWLTVTTFDCIPCANSITATNTSSNLFIAHHSSAVFKTVRALNVGSVVKARPKRWTDLNDSTKFANTYSEFFNNEEIPPQNQTLYKSPQNVSFEWSAEHISNNSVPQKSEEFIEGLISKNSQIEDSTQNTKNSISSFFGEDTLKLNSVAVPMSSSDNEPNNDTPFERFTYISSDDLLNTFRNLKNRTNSETNLFGTTSASINDSETNTMTVDLNEDLSNSSNVPNQQNKSVLNSQEVNDTDFNMKSQITGTPMNVCSEDCAQFLNIELSDADVRKWATIVITGVLYLYAFVMFCIFISTCLALVDLLVVSTFIEGAKLFAGFILIIIDSFNDKQIHFDLIDVKFNVSPGGNGWTADFSYSEYLLDIIIFFLSAYLSIRVFKCFERLPKKLSSVEELVDTSRGTYRPNHSRNSLEPIYEQS